MKERRRSSTDLSCCDDACRSVLVVAQREQSPSCDVSSVWLCVYVRVYGGDTFERSGDMWKLVPWVYFGIRLAVMWPLERREVIFVFWSDRQNGPNELMSSPACSSMFFLLLFIVLPHLCHKYHHKLVLVEASPLNLCMRINGSWLASKGSAQITKSEF